LAVTGGVISGFRDLWASSGPRRAAGGGGEVFGAKVPREIGVLAQPIA
jgi:hypothetical protein